MRRTSRRIIYGTTLAAVLALVAGFATGAISLARQNQSATGSFTGYNGTVTGLKFTSTVAGTVPNPAPAASTGTALSPQFLASGANVFCATTCTASHLSLNVTYTFNSSMTGAIQITIKVTYSGGTSTAVLYLRQALLATSGTIVAVRDVGTTVSPITAVTVTIHQCSGLTCP